MPMVTGHLARLQTGLDFVNTLDLWPVPHDHLESPTEALDWLVEHDPIHREARRHLLAQYGSSPPSGTETLARLPRGRPAERRAGQDAPPAHQPAGWAALTSSLSPPPLGGRVGGGVKTVRRAGCPRGLRCGSQKAVWRHRPRGFESRPPPQPPPKSTQVEILAADRHAARRA